MLGECYRVGNRLLIGQNRQVMLLTVCISPSCGRYLTNEQRARQRSEFRTFCQIQVERDGLRFVAFHGVCTTLRVDKSVGFGFDQLHPGRSADVFGRGVHHSRRYRSFISRAHKARNVGLDHYVFLGHSFSFEHPVTHIGSVCKTDETPRRNTLGQRKLHCHRAVGLRRESGKEESGLVEILTHLVGRALLRCFLRFTGSHVSHRDSFVGFHHLFFCLHCPREFC